MNDNIVFEKYSFDQKLVLSLISAEFKHTKLTDELEQLGFYSSNIHIGLEEIILILIGFEKLDDELYEWYYKTIDTHLAKMDLLDTSTINQEVLAFYKKLKSEYQNHINNVT